ncbi:MAG: Asp23/Gls24 family envelope stress response protein [Puniceicoccaceae bacterium]|nr:Asp23/Gls24 family envelope stress response protein [Puniceicoccaceae bacterium]|tara:strand:- start:868 stop:1320 length:453 start_codon:yes stop_codon:yes gene_type:complete
MSKEPDNTNESVIPTVSEDSNTLGDIRINHSVVASIVRLAALEVGGVAAVGGGFVDGIAEIFSKKGDERGVRVEEDEVGDYRIEIRVILRFGVELAAVATEMQQRIAEQVEKMTSKNVARVNVIIDGVRTNDEEEEANEKEDWSEQPHTD